MALSKERARTGLTQEKLAARADVSTRFVSQLGSIAVEAPDPERRAPHSILTLQDAAVATSGDYRHWVEVQGRRQSHTMDPQRGAPLAASPASVTVVARSCAEADAWATALMVLERDKGAALARERGLDALFFTRDGKGASGISVGQLFGEDLATVPLATRQRA